VPQDVENIVRDNAASLRITDLGFEGISTPGYAEDTVHAKRGADILRSLPQVVPKRLGTGREGP
jgi:hypothetical protein